jgi:hypothetical protein
MNRVTTTKAVTVGYSADYMTEYLERIAQWSDGSTEVEHATTYRQRSGRLFWKPGFAPEPPIGTGKRTSLLGDC